MDTERFELEQRKLSNRMFKFTLFVSFLIGLVASSAVIFFYSGAYAARDKSWVLVVAIPVFAYWCYHYRAIFQLGFWQQIGPGWKQIWNAEPNTSEWAIKLYIFGIGSVLLGLIAGIILFR
jgi:hypothetical protein